MAAEAQQPEGGEAAGRWRPCALQQRGLRLVSAQFRRLGTLLGSWPKVALAVSGLVALAMLSLVAFAEWESRIEHTYVPRGSASFKAFEEMAELFGPAPRNSEALVRARDGGSMLRPAYLQSVWRVHGRFLYSSAADGTRFVDVCQRHPVTQNCTSASIFDFLPEAEFPEAAGSLEELGGPPGFNATEAWVAALEARGAPGLSFVLGKDRSALRLWYALTSTLSEDRGIFKEQTEAQAKALAWEKAFQEDLQARRDADPLVELVGMSGSSVDDEISRNVTGAQPFMAGAINLILIFMALMLGGRPCLRSRLALALGAVCLVMLAEGMGFALAIACGVTLSDVSLLVVFLAVGIGVDDILVLTDAFDAADPELPGGERLGEAFAQGGTAIMLTSLTNLVAFLVASTSDLPAISWFCTTAGWVVLCLFLVTISMYAPLLVLDERRRAGGRYDCLCCVATSAKPAVANDGGGSLQLGALARLWLKRVLVPLTARALPAAASVLVLLAITAAGAACVSMPDTYEVGMPLEGSFPDGSYVTEYLDDVVPQHFDGMVEQLTIVVRDVDFADAAIQQRLLALYRGFEEMDRIGKVRSLLQPLQAWENCTAEGGAASSLGFDARVSAFLRAAPFQDCSQAGEAVVPSEFGEDVAWAEGGSRLQVLRSRASLFISNAVQGRIDHMQSLQRRFEQSGLPGFVYAYSFLFSARDEKLWELISTTLIYAGISVVLTAAIFNHPLGTVLIALCVVMVDFSLFAWMAAWGVPIDAVTFITLAIAAGLSVDYVVHQAHALFHNGLPKRKAEMPALVERALDTTGTSVLKGALSTLLGVMVLSVAPTMVFRLFFKMLFGIVLFGALAGFIMFPASLTLCTHAVELCV